MKKRVLCSVLCMVLLLGTLVGCGEESLQEEDYPSQGTTAEAMVSDTQPIVDTTTQPIVEEPIPAVTVHLVEGGRTSYKVVWAQNASTEVGTAVSLLKKQLNNDTGVNFGITVDMTKADGVVNESTKEIVIGHTNRSDEKSFRQELLEQGMYAFGIKITENKIIITATADDFVPLAVDYFMENHLKNSDIATVEIAKGSAMTVTAPEQTVVLGEKSDLSVIYADHRYATLSEKVGLIPKVGNFKILQGGCATEDYAWFAMINTADYDTKAAGVYIYKFDAKTWKMVKRTGKVLMLDHANDITYIPSTNQIYVAHCYVDSKKASVLNADTLELVKAIHPTGLASYGYYSIAYNPDKGEFIAGTGKTNMVHYDGNMKFITYKSGASTDLTTQGICCDNNYVYHVLFTTSSSPKEPYNMIFVNNYDTGKIVNKIRLSISGQEPENISVVNGAFIIGCNSSSASNADIYRSELIDFGNW